MIPISVMPIPPEDGTFLTYLRQGLIVLGEALVQDVQFPYSRADWRVDRVSSSETVSWFLMGHDVLFVCGMQQPAEYYRLTLCRAICDGKCLKCPARNLAHPSFADLLADRGILKEQPPCPIDAFLRELGDSNEAVREVIATDYKVLSAKDNWYQGIPWIYVGPQLFAALGGITQQTLRLGQVVFDLLPKLEGPQAINQLPTLEKARIRAIDEAQALLDRSLRIPLVEMSIWAIRQGVDDPSLMAFVRAFVASRVSRREAGLVDTVVNDLVQKYRTPVFPGGLSAFVKRLAIAATQGPRSDGTGPFYTADQAAKLITEAGYAVERSTLYRWLREGKVQPISPERTVFLADGLVKRRVRDMHFDQDGLRQAMDMAREKTERPILVKLVASKKGITPRAVRSWVKRRRDSGLSWVEVLAEAKKILVR